MPDLSFAKRVRLPAFFLVKSAYFVTIQKENHMKPATFNSKLKAP